MGTASGNTEAPFSGICLGMASAPSVVTLPLTHPSRLGLRQCTGQAKSRVGRAGCSKSLCISQGVNDGHSLAKAVND